MNLRYYLLLLLIAFVPAITTGQVNKKTSYSLPSASSKLAKVLDLGESGLLVKVITPEGETFCRINSNNEIVWTKAIPGELGSKLAAVSQYKIVTTSKHIYLCKEIMRGITYNKGDLSITQIDISTGEYKTLTYPDIELKNILNFTTNGDKLNLITRNSPKKKEKKGEGLYHFQEIDPATLELRNRSEIQLLSTNWIHASSYNDVHYFYAKSIVYKKRTLTDPSYKIVTIDGNGALKDSFMIKPELDSSKFFGNVRGPHIDQNVDLFEWDYYRSPHNIITPSNGCLSDIYICPELGNIFITGSYDYSPSPSGYTNYQTGFFAQKYTLSGNRLWSTTVPVSNFDYFYASYTFSILPTGNLNMHIMETKREFAPMVLSFDSLGRLVFKWHQSPLFQFGKLTPPSIYQNIHSPDYYTPDGKNSFTEVAHAPTTSQLIFFTSAQLIQGVTIGTLEEHKYLSELAKQAPNDRDWLYFVKHTQNGRMIIEYDPVSKVLHSYSFSNE